MHAQKTKNMYENDILDWNIENGQNSYLVPYI